ncbi:hypothetical protein GCM10010341_90350 [Streptomyces noursei]|nr:hypothetical protein GCM10010341_90350 [Streptomyces noursei]
MATATTGAPSVPPQATAVTAPGCWGTCGPLEGLQGLLHGRRGQRAGGWVIGEEKAAGAFCGRGGGAGRAGPAAGRSSWVRSLMVVGVARTRLGAAGATVAA